MRSSVTFAAALFSVWTAGFALAQAAPAPVRVTSCLVDVVGHGDSVDVGAQMFVRFENITSRTLQSITWRANTQAGTLDFTDTGTFSPSVSIYRKPLYWGTDFHMPRLHERRPSLEASGPGTCRPIKTVSADGTVWEAPALLPPRIDVPEVPSDSAAAVPATFDNPSRDPIGIVSCQFAIVRSHALGHVRFRNLSNRVVTSVQFRAFFGEAGLDFNRQGTFSPGALIDTGDMRRTDLPQNAFDEYLTLDSPKSCTAVTATYRDGTIWRNPAISATPPAFPTGSP